VGNSVGKDNRPVYISACVSAQREALQTLVGILAFVCKTLLWIG
jgi:hypothetical protein